MEQKPNDVMPAPAAETSQPANAQPLPAAFHPHILLVHWEIHVRNRQWEAACSTAQALLAALPKEPIGWIYRSFALHQLNRVREAWEGLLPAARRFPKDWRIAYNLASYASLMGDRAGAWNWLDQAVALGDGDAIKSQALDDPSFRLLWQGIGL